MTIAALESEFWRYIQCWYYYRRLLWNVMSQTMRLV